MLLQAEQISKRYGEETILRQVSLELDTAQAVAITGPSGSGKSTLLSILGLFLQPSQGHLFYQGKEVSTCSDQEASAIRNSEFGFIFQSTQLVPSLTVLDNVLVPGLLARRKGLEPRAKELLCQMGMENRLDFYPYQLSIGQRRRVSIARALLLQPKIVFADEPTNDLDPLRANWVSDFLLRLPEQGTAVVLVSHDPAVVQKVGKRYEIKDGSLQPYK